MMPLAIGVVLALGVSAAFGSVVGLERDRAFYPTVLMVVASYYGLFAVLGGSTPALLWECAAMAPFLVVAIAGFRGSLWWVAAALVAHGLLDAVHGRLIVDPGVPTWWPPFCAAYDVVAGAYLAWRLGASKIPARSAIPA